jgi:hypothetical protein
VEKTNTKKKKKIPVHFQLSKLILSKALIINRSFSPLSLESSGVREPGALEKYQKRTRFFTHAAEQIYKKIESVFTRTETGLLHTHTDTQTQKEGKE